MDTNVLEFWGRALLKAAQSQQQMEDMNKIVKQTIGVDNPFLKSFFSVLGSQEKEKRDGEDILELTRKASETYKEFVKAFLTMADVVPREEHLKLLKENEDLKAKISELENKVSISRKTAGADSFDQEQIVDNLSKIMKNQTQQFNDLMKQLNQPYKKEKTVKKK